MVVSLSQQLFLYDKEKQLVSQREGRKKIKTNYFIVSLAFADLLVSVLVMPFGAIELVTQHWIYGDTFCLVRTALDVLLTTASILHLCCNRPGQLIQFPSVVSERWYFPVAHYLLVAFSRLSDL
ncbi:hypothetical protein KUCAC02_037773 [Chaenocephalus aceratus]|nr:hypothetical protein KUCAC02_037773 [Chaenocephalus aceratus]